MHDYSAILGRLSGVRKHRWGWSARCPSHDDRKHSLAVKIGHNEGLVVKCHVGCSFEQIAAAIGCTATDFFPPREPRQQQSKKFMGKHVARYDYRDETGKLLMQVIRLEPKGFLQRRPATEADSPEARKAGWVWSSEGVRRVPYRLPELLASVGRRVLIAEGEKAVDRLCKAGFVATCSPSGAGKWTAADEDLVWPFMGRDIVIFPDNDPIVERLGFRPGWQHAQQVADALAAVAKSVAVCELPGNVDKGGPDDWLDQCGHTIEELKAAILAAPLFTAGQQLEPLHSPKPFSTTPPPVAQPATDNAAVEAAGKLAERAATMQPADWYYFAQGVLADMRGRLGA